MRSNETTCPPILNTANTLACQDGIWRGETSASNIDYSDGLHEEASLEQILDETQDLSWDSPAFGPRVDSWALEYHLSPLRANILRGLSLAGSDRVLEVGAGCGAITRYLGDMGCRVDAIEGSAARARLVRKRCTGLDQVAVIHGDFHQLRLPDESYDLALFIGVLEYAQRFASAGVSATEAVVQMLSKTMAALSPEGRMVIAIENRLGAKYLSGWAEDHLGTPWSGIAGYPPAGVIEEGIRTFDMSEWENLFGELGLKHRFFFPLPDYKLPKAFVSGAGTNAPGVDSVLSRHVSVNRTSAAVPLVPSRLQQSALYRAGLLPACADSFGIVLGRSDETLEVTMPHDWVVFDHPGTDGQRGICLKKDGTAAMPFPEIESVDQALPLPDGEPLFQYWLRCAAASPHCEAFLNLLCDHARRAAGSGNSVPASALLVGDDGNIMAEGFPWPDAEDEDSPGNVLAWTESAIAGFFEFARTDLASLPQFGDWAGYDDLKQAVFDRLSRHSGDDDRPSGRFIYPAVYWASAGEAFSEERKCVARCALEGPQSLAFALPQPIIGEMSVRFDPSDRDLEGATQTVVLNSLFACITGDSSRIDLIPVLKTCQPEQLHQVRVEPRGGHVLLEIEGNDPWLVIDLHHLAIDPGLTLDRLEVSLTWQVFG